MDHRALIRAWGTTCVGLSCNGIKGYFWNSTKMTVLAVIISTAMGMLNGYVLTKWRFKGSNVLFGLILFGCFIPFQIVLIPMAHLLGKMGIASSTTGLVFVHVVYGLCFTTLYFRNYYMAFPDELIKAAMIDGARFFSIFLRILVRVPRHRGYRDLAVHQYLERLPVRRFILHRRKCADDGGAEQCRQHLDRRAAVQRTHGGGNVCRTPHTARLHLWWPLLRTRPNGRFRERIGKWHLSKSKASKSASARWKS